MATSLKLDDATQACVRHLATLRDRSPHWLMCEAIRQYVDREEKREALRQDALQAWDHYQSSGLHLTGAEADAWLARLEAGEDANLPPTHT